MTSIFQASLTIISPQDTEQGPYDYQKVNRRKERHDRFPF